MMPIQSCLIVGAGMSGLMAARVLQGAGLTVTLLDKGRGVGGRMATRRIEDGVFDHGAQFFTVRDSRFQKFVDEWLASGLVSEWSSGFADAAGHYSPDGHPRYRGNAGMNSIAKALAQGLDVQVSTQVKRIDLNGHGWHLETEDGKGFSAQSLILTAPRWRRWNISHVSRSWPCSTNRRASLSRARCKFAASR
jgi:renalase